MVKRRMPCFGMFHIQVTQSFSRSKILRLNRITLLETKSIKIAQGWLGQRKLKRLVKCKEICRFQAHLPGLRKSNSCYRQSRHCAPDFLSVARAVNLPCGRVWCPADGVHRHLPAIPMNSPLSNIKC